jgi:hypothetical protein
MATRYERSVQYQPTGADFSRAQSAGQLASVLSSFSQAAGQRYTQARAAAGAQAGAQTTGTPTLKSGFTAFGRAYNDAANAAYMARTQIDIEDQYARFELEAATDPVAYEAKSDGYRKGLLNAQKDPAMRTQIDILTQSRAVEGRRRVVVQAQTVERDTQRTDILDGLDSMVQAAARKVPMEGPLADEAMVVLQENINASLQAGQQSGLFTAAQVRQLRAQYAETAQKGFQSGQVSNVSSAIMGQYEADILAGDRALSKIDKLALDDETKIGVQTEVRKRLNLMQEQRKRQYIEHTGALHQDIADGDPSPAAEGTAFALYRKGAMTEDNYTSLVSQIERARVEKAKKEVDLALGFAALRDGTALDPKDADIRKTMDKVFAQVVTGVERGSAQWQNTAIDMAQRTNIVPTDSISWARTIITAGDIEQSPVVADFLHRLEQANPSAFRYVEDDKLKSYASQVSDAIGSGTPPEHAVTVAFNNTYGLKDSTREALKDQYSTLLKGPKKAAAANSDDLQSRLDSDESYDRSILSGAPSAPIGLRGEFNDAVERYYQYTNGNIEQARDLAWRDVKRKWGYSSVNGKPELMPYAPETMFPQLSPDMVRDDVAASVKPLGLDPAKVKLVPSPETAGTGGLIWNVGVLNEYGATDVVLDKNNRPLRYELPVTREAFDAAAAKLKKEATDKARAFSKQQRAMNEHLKMLAEQGDEEAMMLLDFMPKPAEGFQ